MLASYVQPLKQLWVNLTADILSIISRSDHSLTAPLHRQLAYIAAWCAALMFTVQVDGGRQRACSGFICLCKNVDSFSYLCTSFLFI